MISCLLDNVLILHEKLQVDQVRRSEQNTFKRWDILDQHSDKYGFIKVISYDSQKTASAVGSQNTRNQRSWSEEKRHTRKWIGQCESVKSTSMLITYLWFRALFQLIVESNPRCYWFCFSLLCDCSKKTRATLSSNPMHN